MEYLFYKYYKYLVLDKHKINHNEDLYSIFYNNIFKYLVFFINDYRTKEKLKGNNPEDRYKYFNNIYIDVCNHINSLYPNLFNDLDKRISDYLNYTEEIKHNFSLDKYDLAEKKFISCDDVNIINIKCLGDFHNGKCVVKVILSNKKTLIYKPHNMNNYECYNEILKWINENLHIDFYTLKIFNRVNYSWVEDISNNNSIYNKNDFYYKLGILYCLAYVLKISDLHYENLYAKNDTPIILDLEAFGSVDLMGDFLKNKSQKEIRKMILNSVLSSGLLPVNNSPYMFGGDVSGTFGGKFKIKVDKIINEFTDNIRIKRVIENIEKTNHLASKNIMDIFNYLSVILSGFENSYKLILDNKEYFKLMIERYALLLNTRILFRNT